MKNYFKYYIKNIFRFEDKSNWCLGYFKSSKKIKITSKDLLNNFKKAKIFKPPKDEFWADPFLIKHKQKLFIFFEKFYKKKK